MNLRILLGFIIGILGLLAFAPTAHATTFQGKNGKLTFSNKQPQTTAIWALNINNGRSHVLIQQASRYPVWSPNGQSLIFVGADERLWIAESSGANPKHLTRSKGYIEHSPVWSFDGSQIAFVREKKNNPTHSAIFTIKSDGTKEKVIADWANGVRYSSPSWAPRGAKLVYQQRKESENELVIKNLKTGDKTKLTNLSDPIDSSVSWSPNGKKILYNDSSNEVYTIWPDGSHRTVISDGESHSASWSPRGNKVAFLENPEDDKVSISEEDGTVTQVPVQKGTYQTLGQPIWSPDGTKLVFTMSKTAGQQTISDVFLLDLKSRNPATIKIASGHLSELNWQAK